MRDQGKQREKGEKKKMQNTFFLDFPPLSRTHNALALVNKNMPQPCVTAGCRRFAKRKMHIFPWKSSFYEKRRQK